MMLHGEALLPVDLPEFKCPMPVDGRFKVAAGPQARSHLAVYEDTGRFHRLTAYRRSEWEVVKGQLRQLLMRACIVRSAATAAFAFTDAGNASRNMYASATGNSPVFSSNLGTTNDQCKFKYGSGATAPTAANYNIETQMGATIDASSVAYDDAAYKVTASGSRVHTEAGGTIAECAQFAKLYAGEPATLNVHMLDRSLVSPTAPVTTGQTVAVSYEWQF